MEILATIEYKGFYIFIIVLLFVVALLFLFLLIFGIYDSLKYGFNLNGVMAMLICSCFSLICGYGVYDTYTDGATVEYKAKITDFNEVYNKGYTITGKEGKLYILKKLQ